MDTSLTLKRNIRIISANDIAYSFEYQILNDMPVEINKENLSAY
mgnify:CR=1 FL=1